MRREPNAGGPGSAGVPREGGKSLGPTLQLHSGFKHKARVTYPRYPSFPLFLCNRGHRPLPLKALDPGEGEPTRVHTCHSSVPALIESTLGSKGLPAADWGDWHRRTLVPNGTGGKNKGSSENKCRVLLELNHRRDRPS